MNGKQTEKVTDRLQNFYGIPVCSNPGNLKGMWDNMMIVMGYVTSTEKNSCHDKCPKGSESSCKYQFDKAKVLYTSQRS